MNLLNLLVTLLAGTLLFAGVFSCSSVLLQAQPSDTIVANPKAMTLRHIWKVTGVNEGDRVGGSIGSVGDLNNDSLSDFAYYSKGVWRVHYGADSAPSMEPAWVFEYGAGGISGPVSGRFYGNDSLSVGFLSYRWVDSGHSTDVYYQLRLFDVRNDSLRTVPTLVWDPGRTMDSAWFIFPNDFIAVDLDKVPGDELVMVTGVTRRNNVRSQVGEIWIYRGGLEFQVEQPTLIIRDQEETQTESQYNVHVADFDGDTYPDLLLETTYRDGHKKFKFWYGGEGSPWSWTDTPDQVLVLDGSGLNLRPTVADLDGDGVKDLAGTVYPGGVAEPGIYLYLSGSGKDFRSRSFSYADADKVLSTSSFHTHVYGASGGYLNDSSGRYEMLLLVGPSFYDRYESMLLLFSGGKYGPNGTWDALYAPSRDGVTAGGVMRLITPLPDCNGDGWDDLLIADDSWWIDFLKLGIVMVLAGGPEIPNDDPTVSVREEPVAGEAGGLYLWPNPVGDELNIAWKGNLKKMPARFAVHDMGGRKVAGGEVEPFVGAGQWRCRDVAAGVYLLTVYDESGEVIATAQVVKE